jgi:hypothetical protein
MHKWDFLAVRCAPFGRSNLAGDCLFKVGSLSCLHVPALPTALVQTGASVLAGVVYICGGRDSIGTQVRGMHVQLIIICYCDMHLVCYS